MIHDTAQGQTQYDLCEELRAQVAVLRQAATMCRDNHGTASLTAKQLDNMTDELESTAPTPHNQHEVDDKHRTPR